MRRALEGRLTEAQGWVLSELLDQYEQVEAAIKRTEQRIDQEVQASPDPFVSEAIELLDKIVGINETVARIVVAEIGVEMSQFPTDKQLASWAGMCPGNNGSLDGYLYLKEPVFHIIYEAASLWAEKVRWVADEEYL